MLAMPTRQDDLYRAASYFKVKYVEILEARRHLVLISVILSDHRVA